MQKKQDYAPVDMDIYVESLILLVSSALYLGKAWGWTVTDIMDVLTDSRGFALLAEDFEIAGHKEIADTYFNRREA